MKLRNLISTILLLLAAVGICSADADAAPNEVEANKEFYEFDAFYNFINQTYGSGSLERLFNSNRKESEKIETITTWWNSYEKNKKQQTNSYFDNLSTVKQGTYIWNGYSWEKQ